MMGGGLEAGISVLPSDVHDFDVAAGCSLQDNS